MEWIERRAGLIGVGALVVAAVALGVAVGSADSGDDRGRVVRLSDHHLSIPALPLEPFGRAPFRDGPVPDFGAGPQHPSPGTGPLLRRFDHLFPGLRGLGAIAPLHGELTVPGRDGKYQTVQIQRGKVTKLGDGRLTVHSADGFTRSYAASASWLREVKVGDEVQLRATVSNGTATVTALTMVRGKR